MTTEAISIGYAQMRDVLLPSLDGLLEQRIEDARQVLLGNLTVLLVVLAVIGYLSVGADLSVVVSIRSRRAGSGGHAAGDLTTNTDPAARHGLRVVPCCSNDTANPMTCQIVRSPNKPGPYTTSGRN